MRHSPLNRPARLLRLRGTLLKPLSHAWRQLGWPTITDARFLEDATLKRYRLIPVLGWASVYLASGLLVAPSQTGTEYYLWYPPIAIGMACLLRLGLSVWPMILVADLVISLNLNGPDPVAGLIGSGITTIEAVAAAAGLRRAITGLELSTQRDLGTTIVICLCTSLVAATLGALLLSRHAGVPGFVALGPWLAWWSDHATAGLCLLPPLLILSGDSSQHWTSSMLHRARPTWHEIATLSAAVLISYATVRASAPLPDRMQEALAPLMLAPIIWSAVRFHQRTTAVVILVAAISAVIANSLPPIAGTNSGGLASSNPLEMQILLAAMSLIGCTVSIAMRNGRDSGVQVAPDESDLRQLTEELQTALTRLSLAAEAGNAGVWDWNLIDNSLVWDDTVYEMYQIDRNSCTDMYRAWLERVHPDDVPKIEADVAASMASGDELRSTFRVLLPDGDIRYFNTHGVIAAWSEGKASRMIGIDYDVTALVRQRIAAEESEARLQAIFDAAPIAIITMDEHLQITGFNREAEVIFGWSASEMAGTALDRLSHEAQSGHPELLKRPHGAQAERQTVGNWQRLVGVRSDGTVVPLMTVLSKVRFGDRVTTILMCRDLSELENKEAELIKLAAEKAVECERAVTANKAKSEFLAVMSHELRTPLNAIIGFSDLMIQESFGPLPNERYKDFAKDIKDSGDHLLSLISDILDLARIESGKFDLRLEPVCPHEVIHEVARSLTPLSIGKGIDVTVTTAEESHLVFGDRRALRQLLTNLISNSIKFTESGGQVSVATETQAELNTVALIVSDNGRGIPRERIPDLCQPFVQISDAMRRDIGGIGLGLAISRSLAQAMNGKLEIDSDLGCGTTVRVTLPAVEGT